MSRKPGARPPGRTRPSATKSPPGVDVRGGEPTTELPAEASAASEAPASSAAEEPVEAVFEPWIAVPIEPAPGPGIISDTADAREQPDELPGDPSATEPTPKPRIEVDIDPVINAGLIHDRYDLLIQGRVVSTLPVEEAALLLDGTPVGRVLYGAADHAARTALPGGSAATQYVFRLTLPLRRAEAPRICACVIAVRTQDGSSHEERFDIAVDRSAAPPVSVLAGPTRWSAADAEALPPLILYVERAALDDSMQLLVQGWAVSRAAMVTVQVFLGEQRMGAAGLGVRRDDVAEVFPAYANARMSGFALSAHIAATADDIQAARVQAISLNGYSQEVVLPLERLRTLAAAPREAVAPPPPPPGHLPAPQQPPLYRLVTGFQLGPDFSALLAPPAPPPHPPPARAQDPRREIHLHCDRADLDADGNLLVAGWAACGIGIATVAVQLDGQAMGEAELGLRRDDVGDEFRHIPMARFSGFQFARRLDGVLSGVHRIGLIVRNGLDDVREEVRTALTVRPEPPPPAPMAPVAPEASQRFRFEIDSPRIAGGVAVEPITGRLTIGGWVLAPSGVAGIDVTLDDQRLGEAHCGLARQDVGTAFPDWANSLRSGYAFHCPPRSLRNGEHIVRLTVRARNGEVEEHRFRIEVRKSEADHNGLGIRRRMTRVEADVGHEVLDSLGHHPRFRLVLRQDAPLDAPRLLTTFGSLRGQVYPDWTLQVLAVDADCGVAVRALIAGAAADLVDRIDVPDPADTAACAEAFGDAKRAPALVGFLLPGDELGCDALLETALASGLHRDADLLYADEVRISPASRDREPFFKPDFSPDLLLSTNYIGRPWFASTALLDRSGVTPRALLDAGEYDAVLRCAELAGRIFHLPRLLCQRGTEQIDAADAEAAALASAAALRGIPAEVRAGALAGTWRLRRSHTVSGMVSIIMPTCAAKGFVETCIRTLREHTAYRNVEIIAVDNIPDDQMAWKIWLKQNVDTVVPMPDAFNWSYFNNRGAAAAAGEYLLFLNDDIEVTQPDWLDAMLEHAQRPEVAVVGPQLLYPDGKVQHAGMFLATPGVARHAFRFAAADEPGYFGLALTQRNVIAVTGACMLMRRATYDALGGFDEAHAIVNNDLDFCLRAHQAGGLVVFTPHATLTHHEAVSRDRLPDVFDLGHFESRWKTVFAAGDPYFSPRLTRHSDDYRPDDEPVETVFAGHPLFHHGEIRRILVVKVDHIGDFITAIPPIRRLKALFPAASIHVLAGRAARAFAATLDCVDEFIEFEFFNPISGLGPRQISQEDYQALRERLAPYRFDIAVDLRKHLDTRDVLRWTPARFLAGFDHMGQCPFLDVALEWEGDKNLQRKRSHVTDDLLNLVEAIGTAAAVERTRLELPAPADGPPGFLDADTRALFARPVVAIHPGVGNVMRQWPAEHFAALIDLLVERNAVNAVLIGGPEETELAAQVLAGVAHQTSVVSLVGRTPLRELPALLSACALYVGNNSGPKHIAAALGVPTIGIHSGVVDAIEWGPIGRRAVAVRRNMTCSPCYLDRMADCPRNFACMRGLEPAIVREVSEVFLARPIERLSALPPKEPEAVATVASTANAEPNGDGSNKTPEPRPEFERRAIPEPKPKPKPKRSRRRAGAPARVR